MAVRSELKYLCENCCSIASLVGAGMPLFLLLRVRCQRCRLFVGYVWSGVFHEFVWCSLRAVVKPELILQAALSLLLLLWGCYIQALIMLPMTVYSARKILKSGGAEALSTKLLDKSQIYGAAVYRHIGISVTCIGVVK